MVGMRAYHTATLLPSGQVLVAGGRVGTGEETATAELYNPSTGKFSLTGSLVKARAGAAAILLQDSRVLIVGGISTDKAAGGEVYEATAELYDTKKLAFTKTVSLVTGRYLPVLYRVPTTWQVLVIGGWAGADSTVGTLESFDPKTNTFTESGNLIQGRSGMTVTAVADGRLLIMGGWTRVGTATSSVEICDLKTHTCKPLARMPEGRADHTASLLSDGAVVLIGGSVVGSDGKVQPTDSVRLLLPLILEPAN
jgi:hypothetical protein